jgi:hypothetical protein
MRGGEGTYSVGYQSHKREMENAYEVLQENLLKSKTYLHNTMFKQ